MSAPLLLTLAIGREHDVVAVRQRAKHIAEPLGFDRIEQTRIATAVSEIARNAFMYAGGGHVEYAVEGDTAPQVLSVRVADNGPGIANLRRDPGGRLPVAERPRHRALRRAAAGRSLLGELDVGGHGRQAGQAAAGQSPVLCRARRRPAGGRAGQTPARGRARRGAAAESGTAPRARRSAGAAGRPAARQPRARGHQPRRRRALRRARRTRRSPAARRRNQDPVPVEHDPRVPDAAELDSRAHAPARRTARVRRGGEERALLHPEVGAATVGPRGRSARYGEGRGRQNRRQAGLLRSLGALRRTAGMLRPLLVESVAEPRVRRSQRTSRRSIRTKRRSRRSFATSSRTRSSTPSR